MFLRPDWLLDSYLACRDSQIQCYMASLPFLLKRKPNFLAFFLSVRLPSQILFISLGLTPPFFYSLDPFSLTLRAHKLIRGTCAHTRTHLHWTLYCVGQLIFGCATDETRLSACSIKKLSLSQFSHCLSAWTGGQREHNFSTFIVHTGVFRVCVLPQFFIILSHSLTVYFQIPSLHII